MAANWLTLSQKEAPVTPSSPSSNQPNRPKPPPGAMVLPGVVAPGPGMLKPSQLRAAQNKQ